MKIAPRVVVRRVHSLRQATTKLSTNAVLLWNLSQPSATTDSMRLVSPAQ